MSQGLASGVGLPSQITAAWTPTVAHGTITTADCTYTKMGREVTVRGYIQDFSDATDSTAIEITNLPFTPSSDNIAPGSCMIRNITKAGYEHATAYIRDGNMFFYAQDLGGGSNWTTLKHSDINAVSDGDIIFEVKYLTDD